MARITCSRSTLAGRPLFSLLSESEISGLLPWVQIRSYASRAVVLRTGDLPHGLYLVVSGRLKLLLQDDHGREVIVEVLSADQFFGEASLFHERPAAQAVVAQQPSQVLYVPRKAMLECLERNAAAALFLSQLLANRLEAAHRKIGSLGLDDVYSRVVDLLLTNGYIENGTWRVEMGSELIAAMVGASREMVSRVVKDLVERGIVRRLRRKMYVTDLQALRECALRRRGGGDMRPQTMAAARSIPTPAGRSLTLP